MQAIPVQEMFAAWGLYLRDGDALCVSYMCMTSFSREGPFAAAVIRVSSCTAPDACSTFMCSTENGPCTKEKSEPGHMQAQDSERLRKMLSERLLYAKAESVYVRSDHIANLGPHNPCVMLPCEAVVPNFSNRPTTPST